MKSFISCFFIKISKKIRTPTAIDIVVVFMFEVNKVEWSWGRMD